MTAEFAVAMPAVLLVLATALGGVQLAGLQLRLQDAAADAARSLGRGESASTVERRFLRQVPGSLLVDQDIRDGMICVRLAVTPAPPVGVTGIRVEAVACALTAGG